MKKSSLGVGLSTALLGVAGARALLRQVSLATQNRTNPALDPLYEMPVDVTHHYVTGPDGSRVHVIERGTGRALVLIHGVTLNVSIWGPQFHQLADHFRVIAIDVRGHGLSEAGSDGYGRHPAARDVIAVLEHLDLRDAVVVGHSMGGMILMELLALAPGVAERRIAGVVFMDTAAYEHLPRPIGPIAERVSPRLVQRAESGAELMSPGRGDVDFSWLAVRVAFGASPSAAAVDLVRKCVQETPDAAAIPSWLDLFHHDARVSLSAYEGPAMIVVGSLDTLTPVWSARRIARLVPHARLEIIGGAGHHPMLEKPNEVAMAIRDFVAELSPV